MRTAFLVAVVYLALSRSFEMWLSRRNRGRVLARGGRMVERDGFLWLALVHGGALLGVIVEEATIGPTLTSPALTTTAAVLFVLAELARFWCLASLGDRWNVRVIVERRPAVRRGPYALMRHPNYVAAAAGIVLLPLALGLVWTAAIALPAKLLAVLHRIRIENAALRAAV